MKSGRRRGIPISRNSEDAGVDSAELRKAAAIALAVGLSCGLLMVLRFVASVFPQARLWGLNHLAQFPLPFRLCITLLALLFCLPLTGKVFLTAFKKSGQLLGSVTGRVNRNILYFVIAILFFALFWVFRSSTHLLGDGQLQVNEISKGILTLKRELLTVLIHFHAYRLFNHLWNWDVAATYALTSCLSGAIFVFLLLKFLDLLGTSSFFKVSFFTMIICMGSSQLFFGYLENYTLHYLGVFAYIVGSVHYLTARRGHIVLPILLFLLCLGFHLQAICLLPSLAYLCLKAIGRAGIQAFESLTPKSLLAAVLATVLLGIGVYFLTGGHAGRTFLMPLLRIQSSHGYTVFSARHLADFLNEHVLLSSSGIVLLVWLTAFHWKRIDWNHPVAAFLLLITLYFVGYSFFLDPRLGMARDWDLLAACAVGYTVLGIYLAPKVVNAQRMLSYMATVLAATALFSAVPWFATNSVERIAVERFRSLLRLDPQGRAYGYENLAIFYRDKQRMRDTIQALREAVRFCPANPRLRVNLGSAYAAEGLLEEAIREYREAITLKSDYAEAHYHLADVYRLTGRYDLAWRHVRIAQRLGLRVSPRFFEALKRGSSQTTK